MRPTQNFKIVVHHPVLIGSADHDPEPIDLDPSRPDYITDEGVEVWIERPAKGSRSQQKIRFVTVQGEQVGPIHANLLPAVVYASYHGWRDPSVPDWFNDAAIHEVRSNAVWLDEPRGKGA